MESPVVHWEIAGRDLDGLATFYGELFGLNAAGADPDYRLVAPGKGIGGGLMRCRECMPSYVTIYVAVDDLEASLAKATSLGGTAIVPPTPVPGVGSFAMFQDPEGNVIGLMHEEATSGL